MKLIDGVYKQIKEYQMKQQNILTNIILIIVVVLMQFFVACDTGEPVLTETSGSTDVLKVQQNYPNPFNGSTVIRFELFADAYVTVKVYNKPGQVIKTLVDKALLTTGVYEYHFDGKAVSSGRYLFVVSAEIGGKKYSQVKEMLLVK